MCVGSNHFKLQIDESTLSYTIYYTLSSLCAFNCMLKCLKKGLGKCDAFYTRKEGKWDELSCLYESQTNLSCRNSLVHSELLHTADLERAATIVSWLETVREPRTVRSLTCNVLLSRLSALKLFTQWDQSRWEEVGNWVTGFQQRTDPWRSFLLVTYHS